MTGLYHVPQAFCFDAKTDSAIEVKPTYSYKMNVPSFMEDPEFKTTHKNKKMQTYYRDANGRFAPSGKNKTLVEIFAGDEAPQWWKEGKDPEGWKAQKAPLNVVNGRIYNWRGIPVRAIKQFSNGQRLVSCHKVLFGLVKDSELEILDTQKVQEYLENAGK